MQASITRCLTRWHSVCLVIRIKIYCMAILQFFTPYRLWTYLLESLSDISEVYNWNTLLVSLRLSDWSGSSMFVWSSYKALHSDSIYLAVNSACCKADIFYATPTQKLVHLCKGHTKTHGRWDTSAGWTPDPAWTPWRDKNLLSLLGIESSDTQPLVQSMYQLTQTKTINS